MHARAGRVLRTDAQVGDDFNQRVEAGEMPAVKAFLWTTDYNSSELTGLLQSGGYTLLEIKTVRSLQDVDGTLREMVALALHDQQLSDALILPNLEKGPAAFYDPFTRHLRPCLRLVRRFRRPDGGQVRRITAAGGWRAATTEGRAGAQSLSESAGSNSRPPKRPFTTN